MSAFTLSMSLDNVVASETDTVAEKFYSEAIVNGETAPIILGSITEPEYVVVIGSASSIKVALTIGGVLGDAIGAFPFAVLSQCGDSSVVDSITITGDGSCIIMAGGNA